MTDIPQDPNQLYPTVDSPGAKPQDDRYWAGQPEFRPAAVAAQPLPGDHRIGNYKLLQLLGEGGFGHVYLAEQEHPVRRRVAIKVIKLGMDTRTVIARFEAERQALAMMDHPNVAKVLDAGATEQGRPYFVMEYVPGIPITEHCDKNKLTLGERLELFIEVCHAVQHAHQKGIIHRDIKPTNVLVALNDGGAVPKVIDFGVAKATSARLTEKTIFTEHGQLIGTPEYMSPEQAEMSAQDIDTRSDIYSLGVLLYELLTGVLPFDPRSLRSAGLAEIHRVICEVEPERPSTKLSSLGAHSENSARNRRIDSRTLQRELHGDLDWITMKALEKDRSRRYSSAAEFAADIVRHLQHEPVLAGPPSASYRMRKFVQRHRMGVAAAGVALLAIIAGAALALTGYAAAKQSERDAMSQRDQAMIAKADAEQARMAEWRQRTVAEAEMAKAQAISDFLQDMLASVDPSMAQGNEVTVRDALDEAARLLPLNFNDQPQTQAALHKTIGRTYRGIGELDRAETQILASIELLNRTVGETDPQTLMARAMLASIRADQGKVEDAEAIARKAHEELQRFAGPDDERTSEAALTLASVLHQRNQLQEMESIAKQALAISRKNKDVDRQLQALNAVAMSAKEQGKAVEAEPLLRESLKMSQEHLGPLHPDTLVASNNMALFLHELGRRDEALPLYQQTLEGFQKVYGDQHMYTLIAINNLAGLLKELGRLDESEEMYRRNLEATTQALGAEHSNTLSAMHNLASLLSRRRKFDDSAELYRKTAELRAKVLGENHRHTLLSTANLAYVLQQAGKLEEAEAMFRKAIDGQTAAITADHPETLTSMFNLARLLKQVDKLDEANATLVKVIAGFSKAMGEDHVNVALARAAMGEVLRLQGRCDDAARENSEALATLRLKSPGDHARIAQLEAELARCALVRNQHAEAARLFQRGINELEQDASAQSRTQRKAMTQELAQTYQAWSQAEPGRGHEAEYERWRSEAEKIDVN